ncbi:MAG: hypothetical protein ACE5NC_09325 [Anaerolineae bacterium]
MAKTAHLGRQSLHYARQHGNPKQRSGQRGKAALSAARYYTFRSGEHRGERVWITPEGTFASYDEVKGTLSASARQSKHVTYGYLNPHPALDISASEARDLLAQNLTYPEGHSRQGQPLLRDVHLIRHERNDSGQRNPHWHFVAFGDRVPNRSALRQLREGFTDLQQVKAKHLEVDIDGWHRDHPEYDAGLSVESKVSSMLADRDRGQVQEVGRQDQGLGLEHGR